MPRKVQVRRHGNALDPSKAPSSERALDRIQATLRELRTITDELAYQDPKPDRAIALVQIHIDKLVTRESDLKYRLGRLI